MGQLNEKEILFWAKKIGKLLSSSYQEETSKNGETYLIMITNSEKVKLLTEIISEINPIDIVVIASLIEEAITSEVISKGNLATQEEIRNALIGVRNIRSALLNLLNVIRWAEDFLRIREEQLIKLIIQGDKDACLN